MTTFGRKATSHAFHLTASTENSKGWVFLAAQSGGERASRQPERAKWVRPNGVCARLRSLRSVETAKRTCQEKSMPLATQTQLNQRFQSSFPKTQTLNRQGPTHTFSLNACAAPDKIVHLVSDDATRVRSLAAFFSSQSIRINIVRSASELIRNARCNQTACVILDLELPDCNGLE